MVSELVTGTYLLVLGAVWTTAEIRGGTWPSPTAEVIAWLAFFAVQFGLFMVGSYLGWRGVLWMDLFLLPLVVALGLLLAVAWLGGGAAGSTMAFALFVALLLAAAVPLRVALLGGAVASTPGDRPAVRAAVFAGRGLGRPCRRSSHGRRCLSSSAPVATRPGSSSSPGRRRR